MKGIVRQLAIVIAVITACVIVPVTKTFALPNAWVWVTAKPVSSSGIFGLTATQLTDTSIKLDWTVGGSVNATMIRASYNRYPNNISSANETPSDGYLVYYGSNTTCTDASLDFDQNPGPIYYRAWAQNDDGTWNVQVQSTFKESEIVKLIAFLVLPLVLTVASFFSKAWGTLLAVAASFGWGILAFWTYSQHTTTWDIYFSLFWFCIGMLIVMIFAGIIMYSQDKRQEEKEQAKETATEEKQEAKDTRGMHPADKLRMKHGLPVSAIRERKNNSFRQGW